MFAGMLYLKRGVIHNGNKILIRGTVKSFPTKIITQLIFLF